MAKKDFGSALAAQGFVPVAVKATRQAKDTNTVTIQYSATTGAVTFKLGGDARAHFGETVDVYINTAQHSIAFVPAAGAPTHNTATIKSSGKFATFKVVALDLPSAYLLNRTYTVAWDPNGIGVIVLESTVVTEELVEA